MIELGIVGLGNWGRRLVESVQGKSSKARFKAAVVTRPERSADFAREKGIALGSDLDQMLGDDGIDAIVSSGPAHLHAGHSLRALKAGKPVLAVKQMALTAADGKALGDAAMASGKLLALGYNRCFFPNVAELRRRIGSGMLGDILHAEGNFCVNRYGKLTAGDWQSDPANAPAGALADHMLYLMIEVMGRIREVDAQGYSGATPNRLADATAVLLRTETGKSGLLTAIGATADYYRFQVFGSKGWIAIEDARRLVYQPAKGEREELVLEAVDAERAEIEAFADAVSGLATFPVPVDDAVHSTAVIEAMGLSAATGRPVAVAAG
ncbi:MAG: hypothetical protein RLZ98_1012 [Pseudomonadota bacterium]|jgi:predicted dehydrogenase